MIIAGYEGIGRTTLCKDHPGFRYLDFPSEPLRLHLKDTDWVPSYVALAEMLSSQDRVVFVDATLEVCTKLLRSTESVLIILPSKILKSEWVKKLKRRYDECPTYTNFNAWIYVESHFDSDIEDLSNLNHFTMCIDDMNYNLNNIIQEYEIAYSNYLHYVPELSTTEEK